MIVSTDINVLKEWKPYTMTFSSAESACNARTFNRDTLLFTLTGNVTEALANTAVRKTTFHGYTGVSKSLQVLFSISINGDKAVDVKYLFGCLRPLIEHIWANTGWRFEDSDRVGLVRFTLEVDQSIAVSCFFLKRNEEGVLQIVITELPLNDQIGELRRSLLKHTQSLLEVIDVFIPISFHNLRPSNSVSDISNIIEV